LERQEIEKFFCNYEDGDDFSGLVRIEIVGTDFTYVGYIHGWEEPPHEDYIHFQEEEPEHASGRMPISMIKSISWYQDN
jgi:hypothetical protein